MMILVNVGSKLESPGIGLSGPTCERLLDWVNQCERSHLNSGQEHSPGKGILDYI